jgi:hypothetical protein
MTARNYSLVFGLNDRECAVIDRAYRKNDAFAYFDALDVAAGALQAQFAASFRSPLPLYSAA